MLDKKECKHISQVLKETKQALKTKNAIQLKSLSNQTIHDSCTHQDAASISIAVIIYTLSKLVEREDYKKIKNWPNLVKKINIVFDHAIVSLKHDNQSNYTAQILKARKLLESHSVTLKPYIQDVLKKATINKGFKIHEHGISLGQTAELLGANHWELSDYIGQGHPKDVQHDQTIDTKERAKMAMEFFS